LASRSDNGGVSPSSRQVAMRWPMASAWRRIDTIIFKTPLVADQHIKAAAGDHGLNRLGDAIVI
jgi:hypothetical protein